MLARSTKAAALTTTAVAAIAATVAFAPERVLAGAGSETEARLLACAEIDNQTDKLACFDSVAESLRQGSAGPEADGPPASGPDSVSGSAAEGDAKKEVSPADGEKEQEEEPIQATVVRSWQNHDGRFSVELDNGQVWRETQGTRVGQPEQGDSVEISTGPFGSYRMKIENIARIAWVRRTR